MLNDNHFYQYATEAMRTVLDEVAKDAEANLRNAYDHQLASTQAARISLPAKTPEDKPVVHGARLLTENAVTYWKQIAFTNYRFMTDVVDINLARQILREYEAKGLKFDYY